jgi:Nucleotidyltransferase domain
MGHSAWVPPSRSTECAAPAATTAEAALRSAEELACAGAGALGETVAGVTLHGSLTLGDYLPGRSDLDLLVVADEPLGDAQFAALVEAMASRRPEAAGPVDLRLVTRQVAASPTPAPPLEAYLRLTPTSGIRVEERRHPAERDLAVELGLPHPRPQPAGSGPGRAARRGPGPVGAGRRRRPAGRLAGDRGRPALRRADRADRLSGVALCRAGPPCLQGRGRRVGAGARSHPRGGW